MAILSKSDDRLTIVHALFTQRIAGSERYCIDLANRQAALGHAVHVVGLADTLIRHELRPDVRFHPLRGPWMRGMRLRRLLDSVQAQVYHAHLSVACKLGRRLGGHMVRVATLHVGYKPHQHKHLDGLICVNQAQQAGLGCQGSLVRSIPNWLPDPPEAPSEASCDLRAQLGLPPQALLVGAAGRLHPSKGMDLLVQAFRAAAPADAALVVMGEGKDAARLRALVADDARIHLLGYRADVRQLMAQLDLFVSPSREETFGLALLEAMQAGLPIVASATQGPSELLSEQPALLIPPNDLNALTQALGRILPRLQAQGRPRVSYDMSRYHPTAAVQQVLGFYRDALAQRQAAQRSAELPRVAHA